MGFKLKGAPYDKSNMNIAVYKKDLTDGSIGKSNHTGIIVQSGISPEEEQHVIAHEKVHQEQQAKGELDYDKENFYWKGKTYPRATLNEHNEELPWEKEAYKASEKSRNKESKDMGSTKFKLKGHRGNNKPFKHMTERGLIGASMDDTSGYNQPDYGSSMYDDDGASADPPKKSTTVKRPSKTSDIGKSRKELETRNKKSFNSTESGKPLAANLSRLSQTINSKNKKLASSSRKEYATAANLYRDSFSKYEKGANSKLAVTSKEDKAIQKKTDVDKTSKVKKFDPKKASNFVDIG